MKRSTFVSKGNFLISSIVMCCALNAFADPVRILNESYLTIGNQWVYQFTLNELENESVSIESVYTEEFIGSRNVLGIDTRIRFTSVFIPDLGTISIRNHLFFNEFDELTDAESSGDDFVETFRDNDPLEWLPLVMDTSDNNRNVGHGLYSGRDPNSNETWIGSESTFITYITTEMVTVPAGTFECVVLDFRREWDNHDGESGISEHRLWMDPNIGIIKTDRVDTDIEDGLVKRTAFTLELQSTNVKPPIISADFRSDMTFGTAPLTVKFTDTSTAENTTIMTWQWDFDNDGAIDSTQKNPQWTYQQPGVFSVKLTVSDGSRENQIIKENLILANDEENSEVILYEQPFDPDQNRAFFSNIGPLQHQVGADQFILNQDSTILGVRWYGYFNAIDLDSSIQSLAFSISFYTGNGVIPAIHPIYERIVSARIVDTGIMVNNSGGFGFHDGRVIYEFVAALPVPFSANANEEIWISIAEIDSATPATGNTQWLWNFSPFTSADTKAFRGASTDPNFIVPDWELSAQFGQLAFSLLESFDTMPPIINPNFEADITSGTAPLTAQFTDTSTAENTTITSWQWDFDNDGTIDSTEQHPQWTYQTAGVYTVTLTVTDGSISEVITKNDIIDVQTSNSGINDCLDISGTWDVFESVKITITAEGESEVIEQSDSGFITISQNECNISFVTRGNNPFTNQTIELLRTGSITGNQLSFSGEAIVDPGTANDFIITKNELTGTGTIELNRIDISTTGDFSGSVQGIPFNGTITATQIFTRSQALVSILGSDVPAQEDGPTARRFTITRSRLEGNPLTVNYVITGTADNGVDYITIPKTVTIAGGNTSTIVTITPIDDLEAEGDENVILTLSSSIDYGLGSDNMAMIVIQDNDLPTISLEITDGQAAELGLDSATIEFSRSGKTDQALTVNYSLSGTAISGLDYQGLPDSITIPAGETSISATINPIGDLEIEDDETIEITILESDEYLLSEFNFVSVTILNNNTMHALMIDSDYGDPQGEGIYLHGSELEWSVTSPWPSAGGENRERFITDTPSGSVVMDGDKTVAIEWRKQVFLEIQSDDESGLTLRDSSGTGWYDENTNAAWSVTSPMVIEEHGKQFVANPSNGTIMMDSPKTVIVDWRLQWYLDVETNGAGAIDIDSRWIDDGSEVALNAIGSENFTFSRWHGAIDENSQPTENPLMITMDEARQLIAIFDVNGDQETLTLELKKGWNLISLPHFANNPEINALLGGLKAGNVWQWKDNLVTESEVVKPRTGYWLYCERNTTIDIPGVLDTFAAKDLHPGWNLVGVVSNQFLSASATSAWTWDGNQFVIATSLERWKAYWIYMDEPDTLDP